MSSSNEQQLRIAHLMEIIQRDDEDECRALLEAANWNMDVAVGLSLDFDRPAGPIPAPRSAAQPSQELPQMNLMEELNRDLVTEAAPAVSPSPFVFERALPLLGVLFAPFRYAYQLFTIIFSKYHAVNRNAHYTANDTHDPQRTFAQFNQRLEEEIGPEHVELFEGSYAKALSEAKTNLRYFLVIVLGWKHEDTPRVLPWLKDPDFCSAIKRQNMVAWAGSLDKPEAYQVALGFKATKYPFIALVGPSPKTSQSNIVVMEVLLKSPMLSFVSASDLAHTIDEKAIAHEPKLLALRLDRERNDVDRSIRNQQDAAYEESLARDRARAQEAIDLERQQQMAREQEQRDAENLAQWKRARKLKFESNIPQGRTCRVQIRTSEGERIVAKFSEDDTVRTIYEFVLCRDACDTVQEGSNEEPLDFTPQFDFKLISPMTRNVLVANNTPLPREPQVWPNGTLIIEPIE